MVIAQSLPMIWPQIYATWSFSAGPRYLRIGHLYNMLLTFWSQWLHKLDDELFYCIHNHTIKTISNTAKSSVLVVILNFLNYSVLVRKNLLVKLKRHSFQYGLRSTNLSPRVGDLVVFHLRRIGRGRNRRLVTSSGIVEEVDSKGYVKTDTYPNYFRKVLRNITRHSTSMISNDTQSSSEYSISQSYWSPLLYCCEGD